jgi:membrane protease YdiL (CAAX protease family)
MCKNLPRNYIFFIFCIILLDIVSYIQFPPNWDFNVLFIVIGIACSIVMELIFRKLRAKRIDKSKIKSFFINCLIVPFAEELIFRNLLLRFFVVQENLMWIWIIFVSLIFSICHAESIFKDRVFIPMAFVEYFLSGLLIGFCFYFSSYSIIVAIIIHGTQNLIVLIERWKLGFN